MPKTISAVNARKALGQVMNEVVLTGSEYIVERDGKPMVAIVSCEKYGIMERARKDAKDILKNIRGKMEGASDKEIDSLVSEGVKAVRGLV